MTFIKQHELEGQVFGKLTVLNYIGGGKYNCKCECGNLTTAVSTKLKTGHRTKCGSNCKTRFHDITGKRFGKLIALDFSGEQKRGSAVWICQCDCGQITKVSYDNLNATPGVKSCGCSRKTRYDFVGNRFGKLLVLSATDKRVRNGIVYKAICDCGNEKEVTANSLRDTKSCGQCNTRSERLYLEGQ